MHRKKNVVIKVYMVAPLESKLLCTSKCDRKDGHVCVSKSFYHLITSVLLPENTIIAKKYLHSKVFLKTIISAALLLQK